MRNASGHNYWNSSFIIDVAMGQIPRSTERISSLFRFQLHLLFVFAATMIMVNKDYQSVFNPKCRLTRGKRAHVRPPSLDSVKSGEKYKRALGR